VRSIPIAVTLTLLPAPAAAHDVWMQTDRYTVPVGAVVPYKIFVGHGPDREPWGVAIDRIKTMKSIGPRGAVALNPRRTEAGSIRFDRAGVYVVTMETTYATSDLPALRFNDYAKEEGLTPALAMRARLGTLKQNGREIYSRRTKMMVRVGAQRAVPAQVLKPVGQTLEIVARVDPFAVRPRAMLPVQVFYNGRPLVGATVKLTNLNADAKPIETVVTGPDGLARFRQPGRGSWQFNTVWTRPIIGNPKAEFDTTFASLTFGT
jgi:uncharacterized GH25 family protein